MKIALEVSAGGGLNNNVRDASLPELEGNSQSLKKFLPAKFSTVKAGACKKLNLVEKSMFCNTTCDNKSFGNSLKRQTWLLMSKNPR